MYADILALINIPSIVLIALLVLGAVVMHLAQKKADFDFSEMLKDDNGKPSAMRLAIFVCLAASTWVLIKLAMTCADVDKLFNYFMAYLAVWSGAKIVEKLLDVLLAKFGGKS
jgi:hypothetical protein